MWAEYFEQVLNVEDVKESNINVSGDRVDKGGCVWEGLQVC